VSIRVCRTTGLVLLERYVKKDRINKLCALQRTDGKVLWEFESHPIEGIQSDDDIPVPAASVGVLTDAALVLVQAGDGMYYTLDLHDGKKLSEQHVHDAWSFHWLNQGLLYARDGFSDNCNLLRIRGSTLELRKDPRFLTHPPE
jgi:outer membrane protein assembly factor BamB